MNLYPLFTSAHYLSGAQTPWGGSMLRDAFMKDAPEQTGESFEVSALDGCESIIRSGTHAGQTLSRVSELFGSALTGASGSFPLLLKLIDAHEALPEQKTDRAMAWIVLNCDADCALQCGGESIALRPGDMYYLPAGACISVRGGVQLYQLSAADSSSSTIEGAPLKVFGTTALCKGGSRTYYASNEAFELCRLNLSGSMPLYDGRMHILTPLAPCILRCAGECTELTPLESVIVPAGLEDVTIESEDCKLFCASPSDREALRTLLGYRAENVAGLL